MAIREESFRQYVSDNAILIRTLIRDRFKSRLGLQIIGRGKCMDGTKVVCESISLVAARLSFHSTKIA